MVAPQIAAFPPYRRPLAVALLRVKLRHWDAALRPLAARGLAALAPLEPEFLAGSAVPELCEATLSPVLEVGAARLDLLCTRTFVAAVPDRRGNTQRACTWIVLLPAQPTNTLQTQGSEGIELWEGV